MLYTQIIISIDDKYGNTVLYFHMRISGEV